MRDHVIDIMRRGNDVLQDKTVHAVNSEQANQCLLLLVISLSTLRCVSSFGMNHHVHGNSFYSLLVLLLKTVLYIFIVA